MFPANAALECDLGHRVPIPGVVQFFHPENSLAGGTPHFGGWRPPAAVAGHSDWAIGLNLPVCASAQRRSGSSLPEPVSQFGGSVGSMGGNRGL